MERAGFSNMLFANFEALRTAVAETLDALNRKPKDVLSIAYNYANSIRKNLSRHNLALVVH